MIGIWLALGLLVGVAVLFFMLGYDARARSRFERQDQDEDWRIDKR